MGNAFGKGQNEVHIMQSGGCAGGGDFYCGSAVFNEAMDPKLQPYVSQQEYKAVLDKARECAAAHGPRMSIWVSGIPLFILASIFAAFIKGETFQCTAAGGNCDKYQTPAADQCCGYTCCPKERRLQGLNGSAADSGFLAPSGAEEDDARSLLTARRMEAWACFQDEPTEQTECRCVTEGSGKGRREVCYGDITVVGAHVINPEVVWPIPIIIIGNIMAILLSLVYPLYKICALKGKLNPVFEPWRQKGLKVEYKPGSKHYQARIIVTVPEGPVQVLGTVVK